MSILGAAAVLLAGPLAQDPPVTAGILALCIGGISALAGAVLAGLGQIRVLQAARSGSAEPLAAAGDILRSTRNRFAHLPRVALAGCVALLAAYTLWLPAGFWGAVVGSFVVLQVALVLVVVRRSLLAPSRLHRT